MKQTLMQLLLKTFLLLFLAIAVITTSEIVIMLNCGRSIDTSVRNSVRSGDNMRMGLRKGEQ